MKTVSNDARMGVRRMIPIGLFIIAVASSCGGDGEQAGQARARSGSVGGTTSTVSVVLDDYTMTPDRASVPSGTVTFEVSELPDATRPHQFAVYRTDVPPDQLPLSDNIHVDPTHESLELVAFLTEVSEKPRTLRTELSAGDYVLVCNAENHYLKGMWAAFRVT